MLFPTLVPSSLPVVVAHWPSLTKDMQTEQLLHWSGMTDTEHSTFVQHLVQIKKYTH